jgi:hypothetical protein
MEKTVKIKIEAPSNDTLPDKDVNTEDAIFSIIEIKQEEVSTKE